MGVSIQRGNQVASNTGMPDFDEIYKLYAGRILNLVFRFTANEETARDLTQDVFVKVYQNLSKFEQRAQVYTWIYRIAVNHIINHQKKEKKRRLVSIMNEKVSDLVHENRIDPLFKERTSAPTPGSRLEAKERAEIVWAAVRSLKEKYRVPLVLSHYERMSYKEISETLGLSMSAVESRIHRAKKQLIKVLEPWIEHI